MTSRRRFLHMAAALPVLGVATRPALAATPEFFNTGGAAIHGYDPVAYFTRKKPMDGKDAHVLKWMGVTWRFASASNMQSFEADPRRFAPQYGGYCAYAMSQGAIATTVPEAWTVYEGKLYLNFSTGVRGIWQSDIPGHIAAANDYWPQILNS